MLHFERIRRVFAKYNNLMRSRDLIGEGVDHYTLRRFLDAGYVHRVERGVYLWAEQEPGNELYLIPYLFPECLICMDSALFIYEYSDRIPLCWHLAAPQHASRSKFKTRRFPVRVYFRHEPSFSIGATEMVYDGIRIRIYDRERTICDCIRARNRMDREIFNKAMEAYGRDPLRNIPTLLDYARRLRIENMTREIISLYQ